MQFTSVQISNFLTLGEGVSLSLANRGLNLLQGVNSDDSSASSNGAGKSSVVDALCWGLFGVTARGESGDAVVNNVAKKNCSVQIDLQDGSTEYRIVRHRKHSKHKNATILSRFDPRDGSWDDISKGTEKETQLEVVKILGCSEEVFLASVYAGQEMMPDIPSMTDKTLKSLIEEAAGINRFEDAHTLAKEQARLVLKDLENSRTLVEMHTKTISQNKVRLESLAIKKAEEEKERLIKVDALKASVNAMSTELLSLKEKMKAIQPLVTARLARKEEIDLHLASFTAISKKAEKFSNDVYAPAERAHAVLLSKQQAASRDYLLAEQAFANAHLQLEKPCGECGKPHTKEDLDTLKRHLFEQKEFALKRFEISERELEASQAWRTGLHVELETLKAEIPNVSALTEESKKISELLALWGERERAVKEKYGAIQTKLLEIDAKEKETSSVSTAIDIVTKDALSLASELEKEKLRLADLENAQEIADAVVKTFSPAGVRAHILDTVTPFLNDRTATYLGTLSDGNISAVWSTLSRTAKGDLREKFEIEVLNAKGGASFKALSGGEKRKVRLACTLALQDLVASRASKPISLFIGDELDDALDPPGLERLMTILEMKARERGTVVIVSHSDLKDWCDQVTLVEKKGGVSTVSGSLCE